MGQSVYVGPGQQLTYDPITGRLGDPADVDLNQVMTDAAGQRFSAIAERGFDRGKHATRHAGAAGGPGAVDPGELEAAVRAAGASSIGTATDEQFMQALNSVFVRTRDLCSYVALAARARPDLAARIAVAAVSVRGVGRGYSKDFKGKEISCDEVDCIVQAAIAADPSAADEIVNAVTAAAPMLAHCISAPCGHNAFQQPRIITPITPPIPVSPEQPTSSDNDD